MELDADGIEYEGGDWDTSSDEELWRSSTSSSTSAAAAAQGEDDEYQWRGGIYQSKVGDVVACFGADMSGDDSEGGASDNDWGPPPGTAQRDDGVERLYAAAVRAHKQRVLEQQHQQHEGVVDRQRFARCLDFFHRISSSVNGLALSVCFAASSPKGRAFDKSVRGLILSISLS